MTEIFHTYLSTLGLKSLRVHHHGDRGEYSLYHPYLYFGFAAVGGKLAQASYSSKLCNRKRVIEPGKPSQIISVVYGPETYEI